MKRVVLIFLVCASALADAPKGATLLAKARTTTAAVAATFDFDGENTTGLRGAIVSNAHYLAADPAGGGAALAFWQTLFPHLAKVGDLAFYGGTPTVVDPSGNPINLATFNYWLRDGTVAPWMYVNNTPTSQSAGQCVEATVLANFSYVDALGASAASGEVIQSKPFSIRLKLTNLPSGTYYSIPQVTAGEPLPYGLAGYILALENILQYQGTYTLVEQEISDVCPLGNNLNLTGGLAEWAAMNACIQSVSYDDQGETTLDYGPAAHLGARDFVERLRVNRGPRWYQLIGGDLLNQNPSTGPTSLGGAVPISSPTEGGQHAGDMLFPQSVTDLDANLADYTSKVPGVYLWALGHQRSQSGDAPLTALDDGPGIMLARGSGGESGLSGNSIKISLTQLQAAMVAAGASLGSLSVSFVVFPSCETGTGSNAGKTSLRAWLCSDAWWV